MKYRICSKRKSKKQFDVRLFYLFQFVFILTTFNREMLFLGMDFRYIGLCLEVLLIGIKLLKSKFVLRIGHLEKLFLWFYVLVLASGVSWEYNGLTPKPDLLFNLIVLNIYNFLAFVAFWMYKEYIEEGVVAKGVLISALVLCGSMFWVYSGNTLPELISSAQRTMSVDTGFR